MSTEDVFFALRCLNYLIFCIFNYLLSIIYLLYLFSIINHLLSILCLLMLN